MSLVDVPQQANPALSLSVSMLNFNVKMAYDRLSLMLLIDEMFDVGVL